MSNLKPKVIWEGPIHGYPFEGAGATVRVVALHEHDDDDASAGLNALECEVKRVDALGDAAWVNINAADFDGSIESLEREIFTEALLSMANKGSE